MQRILGCPGEPRIAVIGQGCLTEADPAHHAAHEAVALRHGLQHIENPARHQAEITSIARNIDIDEPGEHAVENRSGGALERGLAIALAALAINHRRCRRG